MARLGRSLGRFAATPLERLVAARYLRLAEHGRHPDAEALLARSLRRLPASRVLLERYALCAHNDGRYAEALSRWRVLIAQSGVGSFPLVAVAANLRELGRLEEAKAAIVEARSADPDDIQALVEAARLADRCQAFGEALPLWQRALAVPGAPADWRQHRDRDLVILGHLDEAEAAIAEARVDHPEHPGFIGNLVMLRLAQARWRDAEETARAFQAAHPQDPVATELLGQAIHAAALAAVEGSGAANVPVSVERVEDEATRSLMLGFENIGQDCEFGMVQRRYGAEPLALLRWNHMTLPNLLAALRDRFDGIGDDGHTDVVVSDSGEYYLRDRRYGLIIHTFYFTHQMTADELRPKMLKRVRFLKEKFLGDLAGGEKTLVYTMPDPEPEAMRRLHRALRAFGPVRLLCVVSRERRPTAPAVRARVERIEDDLCIGHLTRFGNRNGVWEILHDEWVAICTQAKAAMGPTPPPS